MEKWEYCILTGVSSALGIGDKGTTGLSVYNPKLFSITDKGFELATEFLNRPKEQHLGQAVAQKIYQLGEEGWEMVYPQLVGATNANQSYIWFKRLKLIPG